MRKVKGEYYVQFGQRKPSGRFYKKEQYSMSQVESITYDVMMELVSEAKENVKKTFVDKLPWFRKKYAKAAVYEYIIDNMAEKLTDKIRELIDLDEVAKTQKKR